MESAGGRPSSPPSALFRPSPPRISAAALFSFSPGGRRRGRERKRRALSPSWEGKKRKEGEREREKRKRRKNFSFFFFLKRERGRPPPLREKKKRKKEGACTDLQRRKDSARGDPEPIIRSFMFDLHSCCVAVVDSRSENGRVQHRRHRSERRRLCEAEAEAAAERARTHAGAGSALRQRPRRSTHRFVSSAGVRWAYPAKLFARSAHIRASSEPLQAGYSLDHQSALQPRRRDFGRVRGQKTGGE
mmetsp:Transcript_10428/g.34283  ORF Transcript_10428/g.34283 Transcript_10428/m.34283 type:complete len:246 (-) Transcript_10428:221-958(-)